MLRANGERAFCTGIDIDIAIGAWHHVMNGIGVAHHAPHFGQLVGHCFGERVETIGPIQGDGGDVVITDGKFDGLVLRGDSHGYLPSSFGSRGRPSTRSPSRLRWI